MYSSASRIPANFIVGSAPPGHADAMSMRCVIVDDSPALLQAASTLLQREGISVVGVASNSAEALQLLTELRPDVALLDIQLGEESGLDLAHRVARLDEGIQTASILISVHPEAEFEALIAASPAAGFVHKAYLSANAIHSVLEASRDPSS
jgi:two-component system nitrate/nitrite response regulator NarL